MIIDATIPNKIIVTIVPTAAVEPSKKLSAILFFSSKINFFSKLNIGYTFF